MSGAVLCLALALPVTASANGPDPVTVAEQVTQAVDAVGGAPAAENPGTHVLRAAAGWRACNSGVATPC